MGIGKAALGFGLVVVLGFAGSAQATTLADLNGGQSLTVGGLTFSDFSITVTGALDPNLTDYKVVTLADGFQIVGGFSAVNGQQGDMLVSYDVTAPAGSPVNDITLAFDGNAVGAHSNASVSEDLFSGGNSIASAHVFSTGSGSSQKTDTATFAPVTSFTVEKDILVSAGTAQSPPPSDQDKDKDKDKHKENDQGKDDNGQGDDEHNGDKNRHHHDKDSDDFADTDSDHHHIKDLDLNGNSATISFVDQRFSVVPEPASLVLLGGGLAGLILCGRRRKS